VARVLLHAQSDASGWNDDMPRFHVVAGFAASEKGKAAKSTASQKGKAAKANPIPKEKATRLNERECFRICAELEEFAMIEIPGDGDCQCHAFADALNRDVGRLEFDHRRVRDDVVAWIESNAEHFMAQIDEQWLQQVGVQLSKTGDKNKDDKANFPKYVKHIRRSGTYMGQAEIHAFSLAYQRQVEVVSVTQYAPRYTPKVQVESYPAPHFYSHTSRRAQVQYPFDLQYSQGDQVWARTGVDTWQECFVTAERTSVGDKVQLQVVKAGAGPQSRVPGSKLSVEGKWVRQLRSLHDEQWEPQGFDKEPIVLLFHDQEYSNAGHYSGAIRGKRRPNRFGDLPYAVDCNPQLPGYVRITRGSSAAGGKGSNPAGSKDQAQDEGPRMQAGSKVGASTVGGEGSKAAVLEDEEEDPAPCQKTGKKNGGEAGKRGQGSGTRGASVAGREGGKPAGRGSNVAGGQGGQADKSGSKRTMDDGAELKVHGALGLPPHADAVLTRGRLVALWPANAHCVAENRPGPTIIFWTGRCMLLRRISARVVSDARVATGSQQLTAANMERLASSCQPCIVHKDPREVILFASNICECNCMWCAVHRSTRSLTDSRCLMPVYVCSACSATAHRGSHRLDGRKLDDFAHDN